MRVLHLYTSWTKGGAEKRMIDLAHMLNQNGMENIIAAPMDSYMFEQAEKLGIKARHLLVKGSFDPFGIFRLYRIVKKEKINILHAHQGKLFWPCIIIKLISRSRVKVVFHRRTQLSHRFYSRWHYKLADKVLAISGAVADGLINREKVNKDKVKVIYNGYNPALFNENISGKEVREKYNLNGYIVVGTVGAMNRPKGKGQKNLIEAARILANKHKKVKYLVVGTGAMLPVFKNMAKEYGVAKDVIFSGYQEEVGKYIAAMDIFCLLSWDNEGFGQVCVEAQALGKPVIATNIGGIPETFENKETGFLMEPENTAQLADYLDMLITNDKLRKDMGHKGPGFVKNKFGNSKMIGSVIEVYRSLSN
jgi:glycosyltransferase involved in cell wall biosynthesis